ncbi:glycoside hydrolase family 128 protein [Hypoxylon rubiginosum]|uniref:Glycoside hydrolase family 128 protein n=1 Tax=Hypoxylon rubiginosum TaxID=110542 RepID=A0ACB9YUR4_9PEZI|nr:glycoside hydrolase family 128 protein [Hypoxylon rubiginosum]
MHSKLSILALCAAASVQEVAGATIHRHKHPKREIAWAETDTVVFTEYVTVTVTAGEEAFTDQAIPTSSPDFKGKGKGGSQYPVASLSSASTSSSIPTVESTSSAVAVASPTVPAVEVTYATSSPTTLATAVKPASSSAAESPVATPAAETSATETPIVQYPTTEATTEAQTTEAAATSTTSTAATSTTTAASSGSGTSKRGAAYNDASLVETLLGLSKEITWAYNWGSDPGQLDSAVMYYPMLWSPAPDHSSDWDSKAEAAIARGSDHFLSFNEPDIGGQANMSPRDAATGHIQYMNPYAGRVKISSPGISSSEDAGKGIQWLNSFFSSCDGKCQVDFCAAHWYGPGGEEGATLFLGHLADVHAACDNKPVWVTEFQAISGDADLFLKVVTEQLDSNSTYSYVEKYSYFMLTEGSLLDSATTLSSIGKIFAGVS